MVWVILSINIKGGTGKSTVAHKLSYALRDAGHDVGVMDADIDSSNLASRFGSDGKVSFEGDHVVKPVEVDGLKLYSMENAFEESSFSQSGQFMGSVVQDMVHSADWGDLDYLVVDCPPGSSDVFEHLVRALRANMLGAISVGLSNEISDTARLVKVCNHNWVPIIGFVENMSGVYCHGDMVTCPNTDSEFSSGDDESSHVVAPFGMGETKTFAEEIGGDYLGNIPLCADNTDVEDVAEDTFDNIVDAIENAEPPELPEDNLGNKSFIRNVWGSISQGIKNINQEIPVGQLQDQFGVEGREPLIIELELTDAGPLTGILSNIIITADGGDLKVLRPKKAKRKGIKPEAGVKITSEDLNFALKGEKKVMRSVTGEVTTEPYSIVDAVKMGDAEVWGDNTINRLAVLDKILSDVVSMSEVQEVMAK